jgi:hypothetical protein
VTLFFRASYVNAEITRYDIGPAFIAWCWLGILGGSLVSAASRIIEGRRAVDDGRRRIWPAAAALRILAAGLLIAPSVAAYPTRSATIDESHEMGAQTWLADALTVMKPNAVVVSWWSFSTSLWYAQRVEHRRTDITILDDRTRLDENLGELTDVIDRALDNGQTVYVIRLDPRENKLLQDRYLLRPAGAVATNLIEVLEPIEVGQ